MSTYKPSDSDFNESALVLLLAAIDTVDESTFHRIVHAALNESTTSYDGTLEKPILFHAVKLCERRGWDFSRHMASFPLLRLVRTKWQSDD